MTTKRSKRGARRKNRTPVAKRAELARMTVASVQASDLRKLRGESLTGAAPREPAEEMVNGQLRNLLNRWAKSWGMKPSRALGRLKAIAGAVEVAGEQFAGEKGLSRRMRLGAATESDDDKRMGAEVPPEAEAAYAALEAIGAQTGMDGSDVIAAIKGDFEGFVEVLGGSKPTSLRH